MNRRRPLSMFAVVALAALVAACTGGSGPLAPIDQGSPSPEPTLPQASPDVTPGAGSPSAPPSSPSSPSPSSPPSAEPAGKSVVRAYFYLGGEPGTEGLVPVLREVPQTQAVARAAMLELLAGPTPAERDASPSISSAVPDGTDLLGISIEDGVAIVDLSGAFASGGGSMSAMVRLAQVTFTLTQFPTVERVAFRLDGRPVTVFGSEGIVLEGPVARDDYHDLLPAIWVDRPAWRAALGNPARVTGLANVFEAQFLVALLDSEGSVLFDEPVMATCGTGCWGTFDVTIGYDVPQAQWGTLRVYNLSARDGSVEQQRDYPVWLTPAG